MTLLQLVTEPNNEEWATWETFWTLWPKRIARMDAARAWSTLSMDERVAALTALPAWRAVWLGRGEMQFVPYPASWIRGHRWEDELPDKWTTSHASHTAAKVPSTGERTPMPDHVREALARVKR